METIKDYLGPMRPPFLILTPAYVSIGVGTAYWTTGKVDVWLVILVVVGALAAHVAVNAFNEYFDFKSGLDLKTERTPFSGGSGSMMRHAGMDRVAWRLGWSALTITSLLGIYFVALRGWTLLPLGVLGIAIIYFYSPVIARNSALCMITPGFAMGPLFVMGADFVMTGRYSWVAFLASLVPFFLLNALLMQNQLPDVEADRVIGRRNISITAGKRTGTLFYSLFFLLAFVVVVACVVAGFLPVATLLGWLMLPVALRAITGITRHYNDVSKMIPFMALTVIVNIIMPILVAIGLFVS